MTKTWTLVALITATLFFATHAHSATTHHRLMWDSDPAHNAVIAFSPSGSSVSPYVKFGYSTNENQWSNRQPTSSANFQGGLLSYFVRLTNLPENSAVYYRVCDNSGCGDRFWFKTAPVDTQPFVMVAGGDTRTGWTTRRLGNRLIAKIRPLFIMHGGDFTDANNVSQMNEFLKDWALTYSSDTIDGLSYKRIYPLIPTHGNHEDNNYQTVCQVFGVDFNNDGQCTATDTYGAFNISPLLRVYTLNTQFQNSGWQSHATAMNNWLANDLNASGSSAQWRFAQYHKPMFPHSTSKSDNPQIFQWWANHFYNYGMNLVVESDTHINKLTKSIRPSGSGFVETTSGGTVYVGEGSWGAPARSANKPKPWTIDLASIQQFKVITVAADIVNVRTAQFDESANTLSRAERENNPLLLPANVNWWHANTLGESLALIQNAQGQTIIDQGGTNGSVIELSASEDTFVSSTRKDQNFNGSSDGLLADGSDVTYGVMDALVKWDLSSVPACVNITSAVIQIEVFNASPGSYQVLTGINPWAEATVTSNSVNGNAHRGALMGTFTPSSVGVQNITLSNAGIAAVKAWLQGNNNGVVIASGGSLDGIDFRSKEMGVAPKLILNYEEASGNCNGGTEHSTELSASDDAFITTSQKNQNFNASSDGLLADGADSTYGEMNTLIKWNLNNIPSCAQVTGASIQLEVFNPSPNTYQIRKGLNTWSESTATWNSVNGTAHRGVVLASFNPSSTGARTISLNSDGVAAVQSWLQGSNNGIIIVPSNASDGIDMYSKEQGVAPKLIVQYQQDASCAAVGGFNLMTQAENYSAHLGVQLENTSDNDGGKNVGWIDAGDWIAYNSINIPTAGAYTIEYRVASLNGGGRLVMDLNSGATVLGAIDINSTGGWQNWTTVSQTVNLNPGTNSFGIYAERGGWNINWWRIKQ